MNNLKKLVIILIRLQALSFMLVAVIYWCIIAISIIIAAFSPNKVINYEAYLLISISHLIIGLILFARSKSLANYFVASIADVEETASQD